MNKQNGKKSKVYKAKLYDKTSKAYIQHSHPLKIAFTNKTDIHTDGIPYRQCLCVITKPVVL